MIDRVNYIDANGPTMYNVGTGRLGKQVSRLLSVNPGTQLGITEELALARATVEDLVHCYEESVTNADGSLDLKMVVGLGVQVRNALKTVTDIAEKAFKIEQARAVSPTLVAALATHLNVMAQNVLGHNTVLHEQFANGLEQAFEGILTSNAGQAANVGIRSPVDIVAAMDATVPAAPPQDPQGT